MQCLQHFYFNMMDMMQLGKLSCTQTSLVFQDTCQGVANIVVSLAENHTKLILDCSLEQDETKKSNMIKLTHLVLVCILKT